jgi:hypothetical protein
VQNCVRNGAPCHKPILERSVAEIENVPGPVMNVAPCWEMENQQRNQLRRVTIREECWYWCSVLRYAARVLLHHTPRVKPAGSHEPCHHTDDVTRLQHTPRVKPASKERATARILSRTVRKDWPRNRTSPCTTPALGCHGGIVGYVQVHGRTPNTCRDRRPGHGKSCWRKVRCSL